MSAESDCSAWFMQRYTVFLRDPIMVMYSIRNVLSSQSIFILSEMDNLQLMKPLRLVKFLSLAKYVCFSCQVPWLMFMSFLFVTSDTRR